MLFCHMPDTIEPLPPPCAYICLGCLCWCIAAVCCGSMIATGLKFASHWFAPVSAPPSCSQGAKGRCLRDVWQTRGEAGLRPARLSTMCACARPSAVH
jgi:hypothetical protein